MYLNANALSLKCSNANASKIAFKCIYLNNYCEGTRYYREGTRSFRVPSRKDCDNIALFNTTLFNNARERKKIAFPRVIK